MFKTASVFIGFIGVISYLFLIYSFSFDRRKSINAVKERGIFFLSFSSIAGFIFVSVIEVTNMINQLFPKFEFKHEEILVFLTIFAFTASALMIFIKLTSKQTKQIEDLVGES